jgi:hypothetical protein
MVHWAYFFLGGKIMNVSLDDVFTAWGPYIDVWKSAQIGLPEVTRWSKYLSDEANGGVREQNSLQHSHSITRFGDIFMIMLKPFVVLDETLLGRALSIHDEGEGVIKQDTLYIDKTESGDLQEYEGFVSVYSHLPTQVYEELQRAFLLQFAMKNPISFPVDAREVMAQLSFYHASECYAFEAIERLDYVMYAMEQFIERGNAKILVQVLRGQIPHLDRLAAEANIGIEEVFWTDVQSTQFKQFLEIYEGKWIEQKGEK